MEFLVLPLLLLAGLFSVFDGNDRPDDDPDDHSGNDTLTGAGTETLYGGAGDDLLTLDAHAVGHGDSGNDTVIAQDDAIAYGMSGDDDIRLSSFATGFGGGGDDTLTATGDATGYGREGDDSLSGSDNAVVMGGDGSDTVTASGTGEAHGGEGDDLLSLSDSVEGFGGAGNDTIFAQDDAAANGGEGDDLFFKGGVTEGQVTVSGGLGADRYVLTDLSDTQEEAAETGPQHLVITDFDPAQDVLGVVYDPALLANLTVESRFGDEPNSIEVSIVQHYPGDEPSQLTVGMFHLQGVSSFDPASVRFYPDEASAIANIGPSGSDGNDVLSAESGTISGEAGDDRITLTNSAEGYGGTGDDTLFAEDNATAFGREGDDSMNASDSAVVMGGDGNDIVNTFDLGTEGHGGEGADTLNGHGGTLFGGPGNDWLHGESAADLRGGIGNDYLRAIAGSDASGEGGNDTISASGSASGYGGAGDDHVSAGDNTGSEYGDETDGRSFAYGGVGNDTLGGVGIASIYGGDGEDSLQLASGYNAYDGASDTAPRAYVLGIRAEGGAGNDTFEDGPTEISAARGDTFRITDGLHIDAGTGDDTASLINALRVNMGAGDDVLILSTPEIADSYDRGTATLGEGADRVAIKPTGIDSITQVLTDFNPAEDSLGLIVPSADSASLTMSSRYDAATDTTVLTFDTGAGTASDIITIRLQGVNTPVTPGMIQLYADDAAALAGTAYRTL